MAKYLEGPLHREGLCRYCDSVREQAKAANPVSAYNPVPVHPPDQDERMAVAERVGVDLGKLREAVQAPGVRLLGGYENEAPELLDEADTEDPLAPAAVPTFHARNPDARVRTPDELLRDAKARVLQLAPVGNGNRSALGAGWVQRALVEYESNRRSVDELAEQRKKRRVRAFSHAIHELTGVPIMPIAERYNMDGVVFSSELQEWGDQLAIVQTCLGCGEEIHTPVEDVVSLGRVLSGYDPGGLVRPVMCASCQGDPPKKGA